MKHAIINARIFTGEGIVEAGTIVTENGKVVGIADNPPSDAKMIDLNGWNISSGFIDIQINGGTTHYFSQEPTEETLHDICDTSLRFGTTYTLPCLISSPFDTIISAIQTVKNFRQKFDKGALGLHLEGPYLNPAKRGAHNSAYIRTPTDQELKEIIRYGKGVIKVMTIAPECFEEYQVEMLIENGILLSAGHSSMTYEQAQHYFSKGITMVTHLYNAMDQMAHRAPGLVGAALDNANVYTPIILDGGHCHYAAARIAYKIKKEKLLLLSDSSFLGRQKPEFDFLNAKLVDGYYRNAEGNLAGAAISMVEAVQNAITHLQVPLKEAINMATSNVARATNMQEQVGFIKPGYPAKFLKFTDNVSEWESFSII